MCVCNDDHAEIANSVEKTNNPGGKKSSEQICQGDSSVGGEGGLNFTPGQLNFFHAFRGGILILGGKSESFTV